MKVRKDMKGLLELFGSLLPRSSTPPNGRARPVYPCFSKLGWALVIVLLIASLRSSAVQVLARQENTLPVSQQASSNGDHFTYMPQISRRYFVEYWYEDQFSDVLLPTRCR